MTGPLRRDYGPMRASIPTSNFVHVRFLFPIPHLRVGYSSPKLEGEVANSDLRSVVGLDNDIDDERSSVDTGFLRRSAPPRLRASAAPQIPELCSPGGKRVLPPNIYPTHTGLWISRVPEHDLNHLFS
ncbi:hypothetical protein KSP39_PZI016667 [Platanthera zijinensis]|uniref:Uncharacterized protein n=1 Tax=Platanthera zijinensis TaxID=2320716 RepID=A0AAP0B7N2_9ASPA